METISRIFKALSEEPRLRIIGLLLERGELCVCEIMAALELPQSTASRHLAYLKKAGWVDDRREGIWSYYTLSGSAPPLLQDLVPLLRRHLAPIETTTADRQRLACFKRPDGCA